MFFEHKEFYVFSSLAEAKEKLLSVRCKGELTIKGITHPIQFKASTNLEKKKLIVDAAKFTVDLQKWGFWDV